MKKIIQKILRLLSVLVLKKYKPEIIGITGSVGKTSTKETIYTVLSSKYKVRRNIKNYNNELGVPLTILGLEAAGRNIFKWILNIIKAIGLVLFWRPYPKILVLEMGADRKGDLKYLTSFVKLKVGVETRVASVHLEFFGSVENVAKEKQVLLRNLKENDWAVLNYDDDFVREMENKTKAQVLTFGFSEQADIRVVDYTVNGRAHELGTGFKFNYQGNIIPVYLSKVLGRSQVYSSLAAIALGIIYEINLVQITQSLKKYKAPRGRMNVISGIKKTAILDDTYNSSPASTEVAFEVLSQIESDGRKFVVLGDMLELGDQSEKAHYEVGKSVAKMNVDYLITVGELARDINRGAKRNGLDQDRIFNFTNLAEAGKFIQNKIKANDFILVKGSQGGRMEKIVKEIMAEPQRAKDLLVRQDRLWTR